MSWSKYSSDNDPTKFLAYQWIIGSSQGYVTCFKVKSIVSSQLTENLPDTRITPSYYLEKCAVDFAGPINIKYGIRRGITIRSYIPLFVCFSTKSNTFGISRKKNADSFLLLYIVS